MTQKAQNRNPTFTIICGRVLIPLSRPLKLLSILGVDFFFDTGHPIVCWKIIRCISIKIQVPYLTLIVLYISSH